MSETIHTVLDLTGPVGKESFRDTFRDIDFSSPSNTAVRLSEIQLRSLLRVLFTYVLHYDEVQEEQRPIFMESIKDNTKGMFDIPQTFCAHLLNNMDKLASTQFGELLKKGHNLNELLANEAVLDFVEMVLVDPTVSFRKWEYGRYAMEHMAKGLLADMDWEAERNRIERLNIPMEVYMEGLDNSLDMFGTGLDDHEKNLLLLLSKNRLWEQSSSLIEYMLVGDIIQSNLVGLNLRKEQLAMALDRSIEHERSKSRDRGGPRL
ncbi:MAG: hypothetical protein AAGC45_00905 [Bacteroidota bacterium]